MKPDAPSSIRGPFQPIASRTPGLRICEHLPRLAAMSDKFCVDPHDDASAQRPQRLPLHPDRPPAAARRPRSGQASTPPTRTGRRSARSSSTSTSSSRAASRDRFPATSTCRTGSATSQDYDRPASTPAGSAGRTTRWRRTFSKRDAEDNPYFRDCTDDELDFRIQGLEPMPQLTLDRLDRRESLLEQFDDAAPAARSTPSDRAATIAVRAQALALVTSEQDRARRSTSAASRTARATATAGTCSASRC